MTGLDLGGADVADDVPLAPLTTLRIGPVARRLVTCTSTEQIVAALRALDDVLVLAGGSNVVLADDLADLKVVLLANTEITVEGNIVQGISRTLWEEVRFDQKSVTSVDWMTYPILDITEVPETVDIVLLNRPEAPPTGAGEPSIRPMAAAIANAVFDATGVRIRRVPFSPERVKSALS